jgi:hypothetical protein
MPDDPYGDPYSSPYSALMPLTVQNPELAQKFVSEHQAAIAARNKEMQDVQQAQQMNTDKMAKLLDDTAAKIRDAKAGQSNLPLIALGANMMGPGDFGTQLGRGLRAMVPAIQQQREADQATDLKLAGLEMQKTELQNMPLQNRLKYIQALQTGDINAMRAIEAAQIRSQGTQLPKIKDLQPRKIGDYIFTTNPTTGQVIKTSGGASPEATLDPMGASGLEKTPDASSPDLDALKLGQGKLKGDLHPEVLDGQPDQVKTFVKMLVDGTASLPAGRKINADTQFFLDLAHKYDPSFSQSDFQQRANTIKAFSTGRQGDQVRQLNTAYRHAYDLLQYAAKLPGDTEWTDYNGLRNNIARHFGNTDVTQFDTYKTALIGEAAKFFHGTASEGAEQRWQGAINDSQTPQQLQKAVTSLMRAIHEQASALAEQKSAGMNRTFTVDDLMGQAEREKLKHIEGSDFSSPKGREAFLQGTQKGKDSPTSSPSGREAPPPQPSPTGPGPSAAEIEAEMRRRGLLR